MENINIENKKPSSKYNLLTFFRHPSKIPAFLIDSNGDGTSYVTQIREEVLKEWDSHPDKFDILDRYKIENHNDTILRYFLDICESEGSNIKEKDAVKKTVKSILSTLKWRKDIGINQQDPMDIPAEMYESTARPYIGTDGRMYGLLRPRYYYKCEKAIDAIKVPVMHLWEKEYERLALSVPNGAIELKPCIITDMRGFSMHQIDTKMVFKNRYLMNHYPGMCYESILVGFPDWLTSIAQMGMKLAPQNLVDRMRVMTIEELIETIGIENTPTSLGGTFKVPYLSIPEGVPTTAEFMRKRGISEKDIRGFYEHWKRNKEWGDANCPE